MRNPIAALTERLLTKDKDRKDIEGAQEDVEKARRSAAENERVLRMAARRDPLVEQTLAAYRGEKRVG